MTKVTLADQREEKPQLVQDKKVNTTNFSDGYPSPTMDDAVYTMDDSRVLMGGSTTPDSPTLAQ